MDVDSPLRDLSGEVGALTLPLAQELNHSLLRVYSYIQPPYSLSDDETYQVDLTQRKLTILYGDQPAFEAPVQVLGTYNRDEKAWLWPRANSSLRPDAFQFISSKLAEIEGLRALLEPDRFSVREDLAFSLAAWLARESACFGVYPALFDDGLYVFLALETLVGLNDYVAQGMRCGFCYCDSNVSDRFIPVGEHLGICSDCIRNFAEIALMDSPGGDLATVASLMESESDVPDTHPTTPCIACGYQGKRIFGSEASLCYHCLAACGAAIGIS